MKTWRMIATWLALVAGTVLSGQTATWPNGGEYTYDGAGHIASFGSNHYKYDAYGRLTYAEVPGHFQRFEYDRFGNLTSIETDGASATAIVPGVDPQTNRISISTAPYNASATYDNAGRTTAYLGNTFTYDGTDTVTESTVDGFRHIYLYSATDERIASIAMSGNTKASTEWTVRDTGGQVLRRYDETPSGTFTWREDYIYRGTQLLASEVDTDEKIRHFHLDHLGTPRLITGNGGVKLAEHTYYPFGLEVTSPQQDPEKRKFTGHERDTATLDYMHARYYNVAWGRFLSVDPTWESADLGKPQSWNRYAYVLNNPVNAVDPDGRVIFPITNPGELLQKTVGYATKFVADYIMPDGEPPSFEAGYSENADKPDLKTAAVPGAVVTGGEILTRRTSNESAKRLAAKAAEAEEKIGIHGVSATAKPPAPGETVAAKAARSEVEKVFKVHDTPVAKDILHRTIELPKPVTNRIAKIFNRIFKAVE